MGEVSESAIVYRLLQQGYSVSQPFGDNQPYDLILDLKEGGLKKVQCKTLCSNPPSGILKCKSINYRYFNTVDLMAFYDPILEKVYLVPIDIIGNVQEFSMRTQTPLNNQWTDLPWAKDYELKSATNAVKFLGINPKILKTQINKLLVQKPKFKNQLIKFNCLDNKDNLKCSTCDSGVRQSCSSEVGKEFRKLGKLRECAWCSKPFEVNASHKSQATCSVSCGNYLRGRNKKINR